MKHLLWVVGLVALVLGLWFLNLFLNSKENQNTHYLIYAGLCFLVGLICLAIFFFKKFREEGQ